MQRKRGKGRPDLLPARTQVFLTQPCTELALGWTVGTSTPRQEVCRTLVGLRPAWLGWGGLGGARDCEVSLQQPPGTAGAAGRAAVGELNAHACCKAGSNARAVSAVRGPEGRPPQGVPSGLHVGRRPCASHSAPHQAHPGSESPRCIHTTKGEAVKFCVRPS